MSTWFSLDHESDRNNPHAFSKICLIATLALAYYSTAIFSLIFAVKNTNITPIWLPSGVALASIWVFGYRIWPGIMIGAFLANVSTFLFHQFGSLATMSILSTIMAVGNTIEACAAVYLLKKFIPSQNPLHSVEHVLKFFGIILIICLANALFGSASVCLLGKVSGNLLVTLVMTWWLGDTAGILTLAPIILALHQFKGIHWSKKRLLESLVLLVSLMIINGGIFWGKMLVSKSYLLLPVVVWSAYRFGVMGASVATLMTLGVAMAGTINGMGPFAHADLNISLLTLFAFVGVISFTGLVLAAAVKDRFWALEEAQKREQRFRSLVENSTDMISVITPETKIIYASPSVTRILGYDLSHFIGQSSFDFIHPEDIGQIRRLLAEVLSHPNRIVSGGCRLRHKNDTWRFLEGTGINLLSDPSVGGIVINYRDITEKKKADEDQVYLKAIIENSEDGIIAMSMDGIITSWNRGAEKIYGYRPQEILGKPAAMLLPEDRIDEIKWIIQTLKDRGLVQPLETVRKCKDGQILNISLRASPIKDFSGRLIGVSAIVRDITERKKVELALRESEARFHNMADTAPVMIWVSGRDTLFNFCNKAWLDFTGRPIEQELGSGWVENIHPDDIQRCHDLYIHAFDRREKFSSEFRLHRWDGEYRWILNTAVPRFSGDKKFEGFIGSCIDITERRLAEEILKRDSENLQKTVEERSKQLDHMQAELKKAARLADIGTLAGTVAHELRNPLGVIQMAAFNLKRKHPQLAQERHLTNIEKKVWEGERIISNLLMYASIKVPRYEEISVIKILDRSLNAVQDRFQDSQISIARHYGSDEVVTIEADQLQLMEIFNNIILNAYQSFPDKKGAIELAVQREDNAVSVSIKDNGAGIEHDDLKKVFTPFFTRKAKGTGLGLAICNELVHLHNGTIDIVSEAGKGTSVCVTFPSRRERAA